MMFTVVGLFLLLLLPLYHIVSRQNAPTPHPMRISVWFLIAVMVGTDAMAQELTNFKFSECSRDNPHIVKMNQVLNKMIFKGDHLEVEVTWVTGCSFDPMFRLEKIDRDTIFLTYQNKNDDALFCACEYRLHFTLSNVRSADHQVKINDRFVDKTARRYQTDGYMVEYLPERGSSMVKLRELYSEKGKLLAEVYYNREGAVTLEKYYNQWGFFEREKKY